MRRRHVCAGEKKRTLRKSAFCDHTLTEKRTLHVGSHGKAHFGSLAQSSPHGKAHSACEPIGKAHPTTCRFARVRLSVRRRDRVRLSVRRRHVCAGEEKRTLRKSAFCDHTLTEKRILYVGSHEKAHFGSLAQSSPHGKAHSATTPSRKTAFCALRTPAPAFCALQTPAPADACPRRRLPRRCSSNV